MDFHKQENTSTTTPSPKRMMMMMKNKTTSPSSSSSLAQKNNSSVINFEHDTHDDQAVSDDDQRDGMAVATTEEKKQKRFTSAGRGVAAASGGAERGGAISCQAEKCSADLTVAKRYHRRHKVCEFHAKAPSVLVSGLCQRFCQQCSRFHELSEFDETKRSCRRRLAGHNERRRKSTGDHQGEGGSSSQTKTSNPQLRAGDHERAPNNSNIGTSTYKQYQMR